MKTQGVITAMLIMAVLCVCPAKGEPLNIKNADQPARGEHTFKLDKIWSVSQAEGLPFAEVRGVLAAENGTICVYDRKNLRYFLFDRNGKFIRGFGKKGEGPGEIKRMRQAQIFSAGNLIAAQDTDRIHFFDWNGKFIRSRMNNVQRFPVLFLSEKAFISTPRSILAVPEGKAKVKRINLETGKEQLITTFTMRKSGTLNEENIQVSLIVSSLTPMFILGKHGDRIYYGINDTYSIQISDLKGNALGRFSLDRSKTKVDERDKIEWLTNRLKDRMPADIIQSLAKRLPNEETYYNSIISYNGLMVFYKPKFRRKNIYHFDIFSLSGKYLYRYFIRIEPGSQIVDKPLIDNGFVYLVSEDADGEIILTKYKIDMPVA